MGDRVSLANNNKRHKWRQQCEEIMSGGRKIDDHSFWAGGKSKGSVFPEGVHVKEEHSADSAGELMDYEDTTEKIHSQQEMSEKKAKKHNRHPLMRN